MFPHNWPDSNRYRSDWSIRGIDWFNFRRKEARTLRELSIQKKKEELLQLICPYKQHRNFWGLNGTKFAKSNRSTSEKGESIRLTKMCSRVENQVICRRGRRMLGHPLATQFPYNYHIIFFIHFQWIEVKGKDIRGYPYRGYPQQGQTTHQELRAMTLPSMPSRAIIQQLWTAHWEDSNNSNSPEEAQRLPAILLLSPLLWRSGTIPVPVERMASHTVHRPSWQ